MIAAGLRRFEGRGFSEGLWAHPGSGRVALRWASVIASLPAARSAGPVQPSGPGAENPRSSKAATVTIRTWPYLAKLSRSTSPVTRLLALPAGAMAKDLSRHFLGHRGRNRRSVLPMEQSRPRLLHMGSPPAPHREGGGVQARGARPTLAAPLRRNWAVDSRRPTWTPAAKLWRRVLLLDPQSTSGGGSSRSQGQAEHHQGDRG